MPVTSQDLLIFNNGDGWVKTARGWRLQHLDEIEYIPTCERLTPRVIRIRTLYKHLCRVHLSYANSVDPDQKIDVGVYENKRPDLSNTSKQVSFARNVLVNGCKGQRKVSVCLSDFLKFMDVELAVTDLSRKDYLFDMISALMKGNLPKMSGTAHRELFKILEKTCNEALETEYHLDKMRTLLQLTIQELTDPGVRWIGAKSMWNRHIQLVNNLLTKLDQHNCYERKEDGQLFLTDLNKECLREIMWRLGDHKDIIHFGRTCSDLYDLSEDNLMWERLTQRKYTEKQMLTFIDDTNDIDDTLPWKRMYRKCYKKFGEKKSYTNGLVICSACKTLHWMLTGHSCWSSDDKVATYYLDPVTPDDLMNMLNL